MPLSVLQKKFICGEIPPRDKAKSFKRPLQFKLSLILAFCLSEANLQQILLLVVVRAYSGSVAEHVPLDRAAFGRPAADYAADAILRHKLEGALGAALDRTASIRPAAAPAPESR